jgi:phosphoglycerate dehydrogenase-like enzyme
MARIKAAFFNQSPGWGSSQSMIERVYGQGRREQLQRLVDMHPTIVGEGNFDAEAPRLAGIEAIFSTWGMPLLTDAQLDSLPRLKAVFYAAGSVKGFAAPLLQREVTVVSAWAANAVCVAEFCLAQILLAMKGYFANTRHYHATRKTGGAPQGRGAYGESVALLGAGQVARQLITLLKPFRLNVLVVDPYLSDSEARELGVRPVSLDEAFAQAYVVSNHLPNLPELRGILHGALFASMRPEATFINTGRGAQVVEPELMAVLRQRPDLTALLDVTDPEPAPPQSQWFTLPNVQLTTHIAGAHGDEVVRMADLIIEEFGRWQAGEPLRYQVTAPMLARMA